MYCDGLSHFSQILHECNGLSHCSQILHECKDFAIFRPVYDQDLVIFTSDLDVDGRDLDIFSRTFSVHDFVHDLE